MYLPGYLSAVSPFLGVDGQLGIASVLARLATRRRLCGLFRKDGMENRRCCIKLDDFLKISPMEAKRLGVTTSWT